MKITCDEAFWFLCVIEELTWRGVQVYPGRSEMSWAAMHVPMQGAERSEACTHLQFGGTAMHRQNICLGSRLSSHIFFLCPETLSRHDLKNTCPFGLDL